MSSLTRDENLGVVEGKPFLQHEAQLESMTSLDYGSSGAGESSKEYPNLGGGGDPAGLWSHHNLKEEAQKMTRCSTMEQTSTSVAKLDTRTSRAGKLNCWTRAVTKSDTRTSRTGKCNSWTGERIGEMQVINALNLDIVERKDLPKKIVEQKCVWQDWMNLDRRRSLQG